MIGSRRVDKLNVDLFLYIKIKLYRGRAINDDYDGVRMKGKKDEKPHERKI